MRHHETDKRELGKVVDGWRVPPMPEGLRLKGRYAWLEPLSAEAHSAALFGQFVGHDWLWDYLYEEPFTSAAQYHRWVRDAVARPDFRFFALFDQEAKAPFGIASYMRIRPQAGSIELGNICLSPKGQKSRAATEVFFLTMQWAFDVGYRRFEWKCNALNIPSRRAAERLGLSYEGIFRSAAVVKGRNRDTAWFAATIEDWPALKSAFEAWLDPSNFDTDGQQRERLSDLTRLVRVSDDPVLNS